MMEAGPSLCHEALYAEFAPLVGRLICQYGHDSELRQDLPGEIYCRFCALLDAYDPDRGVPLRPYLLRQLSAATYTYARQQWRRHTGEVAPAEQQMSDSQASALDLTPSLAEPQSQQRLAFALPDAIGKLPERQRRVVIWRYYDEKSFGEIEQILGVQAARARSLLRQGLNKLRTLTFARAAAHTVPPSQP